MVRFSIIEVWALETVCVVHETTFWHFAALHFRSEMDFGVFIKVVLKLDQIS